jgi:hypothetical protein
VLPWSELVAVCAWSQGPPSGGREGTVIPHHLAFLPAALPTEGHERTPPETGAELLAIKVTDVPCVPTLRWSVAVRPDWDTTVEEIAKAVQDFRDDVVFVDCRDVPKPRKHRASPGKP